MKPGLLTVSWEAIYRFNKRIARLYEQGADSVRIGQYVVKWFEWAWWEYKPRNPLGITRIGFGLASRNRYS